MNRRDFLLRSALVAASTCLSRPLFAADAPSANAKEPLFKISLAEWSLHRLINSKKLDNLDFPKYSKTVFGIDAVEYVSIFFKNKAKDLAYLGELKKRSTEEGVTNVLIMVDGEGAFGAKDAKERLKTVDNHKKWVEAAKFLGCHTIRVNANGKGTPEEHAKQTVEGLRSISEFAKDFEINVVVENHGGLSSNGAWLSGVLKEVNMPNCGALPDFGNFYDYDRYQGIADLMPYAKGVSAKSRKFNEAGDEMETDFLKAMQLVMAAGYHGHVGIEWEGGGISEDEGVKKTKALLERVHAQLLNK